MKQTSYHPSRRDFLGIAWAACLWPGAVKADVLGTLTGTAFGTTWKLTGQGGAGLERLRSGIEALFDDIDRQMSPWQHDSAVSLINAAPAGRYPAQQGLIHVTQAALGLAQDGRGVFDPTVGPLVAQWGFGPISGEDEPKWRGFSVDGGTIVKTEDRLTLDLCGIAKGWALDRAVDLVREAGLGNVLFDLGGELKALGRHPSGRTWRVAVQNPVPGHASPALLNLPDGMAVATSSLRNQSYRMAGRTYGHIIDPLTKTPADSLLTSVSVVASDAITADGWATALFAAGHDAGPALAREHGIAALFLIGDGPVPEQVRTGSIADHLV